MKSATKTVSGRFVDLGRATDLLEPPVVQHGNAIAQGQRLFLIVGNEHRRDADAAGDVAQFGLHLLAQLAVERRERLVQQQHPRIEHQRAGDRDALLLAAGQLRRQPRRRSRRDAPDRAPRRPARLRSAALTLRMRSPKPTFCATVMCGNSARLWNTMPMSRRWIGIAVTSRSPIVIVPRSIEVRPATARRIELLPQPLGPSSVRNSPEPTDRQTSSTARVAPNLLVIWSRTIAAISPTPFASPKLRSSSSARASDTTVTSDDIAATEGSALYSR